MLSLYIIIFLRITVEVSVAEIVRSGYFHERKLPNESYLSNGDSSVVNVYFMKRPWAEQIDRIKTKLCAFYIQVHWYISCQRILTLKVLNLSPEKHRGELLEDLYTVI